MIYLFTFLIFIFGLILGFYFNFPFWKFIKTLFSKGNSTIDKNIYFNVLEINVMQKFLASKNLSISTLELNSLINSENLSDVKSNQIKSNQIRGYFLKDFNFKLQFVFGISNGIYQVDSFEDQKLKKFMLSKKFNVSQLNKIFLS